MLLCTVCASYSLSTELYGTYSYSNHLTEVWRYASNIFEGTIRLRYVAVHE